MSLQCLVALLQSLVLGPRWSVLLLVLKLLLAVLTRSGDQVLLLVLLVVGCRALRRLRLATVPSACRLSPWP